MMDYYWLTDISQEGGLRQVWKDYKSEKLGNHAQVSFFGFRESCLIKLMKILESTCLMTINVLRSFSH